MPKRAAPRVAFGSLVEMGLIVPGTELVDHRQRWSALVRADGTLASGPHSGSIHRVGAPEIARAMTSRWISEVPSKIV